MPPPGRGRGRGGWGPGFRGGRGFWGPRTPLFPVAAIARAATAPPPPPLRRRRFPAPRPGFVYVIRDGRPLAVRAEETAFLVQRVSLPSVTTGPANEVLYKIQVTITDGFRYDVTRRYSQFDQLRASVGPSLRVVTPPFPPKRGMRSATTGLGQADIEERRAMLQAWLQSLVTAASHSRSTGLRLPLYDFLEMGNNYPPDTESTAAAGVADSEAGWTASAPPPAQAPSAATDANSVPYASATPIVEAVGTEPHARATPVVPITAKGDGSEGWGIPTSSREASDLSLAIAGPDAAGKLEPAKAAEALRSGTGAATAELRAIWDLSDIDKDGKLDREEFAVAWYLAKQAAEGTKPPATLPDDIVPPSKRVTAPASSANPF